MTPEEFRELRKQMGMSQEDVAGALGVRGVTVCRWEKGTAPIAKAIVLAMRYIEIQHKMKQNDTEF